jgi:3-isopropylmalate/(R)-2-methylmalate dehydratase small subunit
MIRKINNIEGKAIPLIGNDIDTDRIIPARFMKCLTFDGLGQFAFYDERFEENGAEKNHPLNNTIYSGHSILITNRNFGCGSSREHAPWALHGIGIRCIIAQSYAEIFAGNCNSLGIPAVLVSEEICKQLQNDVQQNPDLSLSVDLNLMEIHSENGSFPFNMQESYRMALVEGKWDSTSMLLESLGKIKKKHINLPQLVRNSH